VRLVVVDEMSELESSVEVIAEVDALLVVVDRHGMKEIVAFELIPVHEYRKLVAERVVGELVSVVGRVSVQL